MAGAGPATVWLTSGFAGSMLGGMVSDKRVYRAADRLITRYGDEALNEANRLICDAVRQKNADRALFMVRIRLAIMVLQSPPTGPLH
jgi:hypothetical protein